MTGQNTVRYKIESIGDIYMGVHCTIISTFLYSSKFFIIRCLEKNYRHSFKSLTDPLNCWYVKLPWLQILILIEKDLFNLKIFF